MGDDKLLLGDRISKIYHFRRQHYRAVILGGIFVYCNGFICEPGILGLIFYGIQIIVPSDTVTYPGFSFCMKFLEIHGF